MQTAIIDFHYRPERAPAYAALARSMQLLVLVVGPAAPQSTDFAWAHLAQPRWATPLAVGRNLKLARARHWIAVEPSAFELMLIERLAKHAGVTWEAWLDASQGTAWSAYLARRALGQRWEAVHWRAGLGRLQQEAA